MPVDQDSVRLLAVEACVSIASLLQTEDVEQLVILFVIISGIDV